MADLVKLNSYFETQIEKFKGVKDVELEQLVVEALEGGFEIADNDDDPVVGGERVTKSELDQFKPITQLLLQFNAPTLGGMRQYLRILKLDLAVKQVLAGKSPTVYDAEMAEELVRKLPESNRPKRVTLDFGGSWCPPCIWMKKYVFAIPERLAPFKKDKGMVIHIEVDKNKAMGLRDTRWKISQFPTLLFANIQITSGIVSFQETGRIVGGFGSVIGISSSKDPNTDPANRKKLDDYLAELAPIIRGENIQSLIEEQVKALKAELIKPPKDLAKQEKLAKLQIQLAALIIHLDSTAEDKKKAKAIYQDIIKSDPTPEKRYARLASKSLYNLADSLSEKADFGLIQYQTTQQATPFSFGKFKTIKDFIELGDSGDFYARALYKLGKKDEAINFYLSETAKYPFFFYQLSDFIEKEPLKVSLYRSRLTNKDTIFRNIPIFDTTDSRRNFNGVFRLAKQKGQNGEPLLNVILLVNQGSENAETFIKKNLRGLDRSHSLVVYVDSNHPEIEQLKEKYKWDKQWSGVMELNAEGNITLSHFVREQKKIIDQTSGVEREIKVREALAQAIEMANSDLDLPNKQGNRVTQEEVAKIKDLIPRFSTVYLPSDLSSHNLKGYVHSLKISAALKKAEEGFVIEIDSIEMAKEIILLFKPKRFALDVYADWCTSCHLIDKDILSNPNHRKILTKDKGIIFKIDRKKMSESEINEFGATFLPQLILLNGNIKEDGSVQFSEIGRMDKPYMPVTDQATKDGFIKYLKELQSLTEGIDPLLKVENELRSLQQSGSSPNELSLAKLQVGRKYLSRISGDKKHAVSLLQEVIVSDRDGRYGAADALFLLARTEKDYLRALDYYMQLYKLPHYKPAFDDNAADLHVRELYDLGKKTETLDFYLKWVEKSPLQGFDLFYRFISGEPDKISWVRATVTKTAFRNIPIDLALKAAKEKPEKSEPLLDVILVVGNSSKFEEIKRETAMNSKQEAIVVFVDEKHPDFEKIKEKYGKTLETPFILRLDATISGNAVEEKIKTPPAPFTTLANFYSQQK